MRMDGETDTGKRWAQVRRKGGEKEKGEVDEGTRGEGRVNTRG